MLAGVFELTDAEANLQKTSGGTLPTDLDATSAAKAGLSYSAWLAQAARKKFT